MVKERLQRDKAPAELVGRVFPGLRVASELVAAGLDDTTAHVKVPPRPVSRLGQGGGGGSTSGTPADRFRTGKVRR
jgi:hypothetical protein